MVCVCVQKRDIRVWKKKNFSWLKKLIEKVFLFSEKNLHNSKEKSFETK